MLTSILATNSIKLTNRNSSCDFLGRTILTVTPMGTVSNAYDGAASRLLSTTSSTPSTSSTTTYLYDDLGSQVGTLKYGITDASETRYETIGGEIWRVTTQSRTAGGVTGGVSVVRSQMTGLSNSLRSLMVSTSANGMTSVSLASFDPESKILATTTQIGNATPSTTFRKYGVVIETQNRSAQTLYYNDAFLLPYQVWTYKPGDELLTRQYMEEIDEETWQPLRTSTRLGETANYIYDEATYDASGQTKTQTDDLGNTTTHSYDVLNRTVAVSGDTYPIRYGYDTMGRMKELRTTRNGSTFDETRWLYNHVTGLVTNKLYADDSTVAYAYTDDGKPHRTTWARGAWKENAYDSRELLVAQTYSDDTPDVEYSYNDFGSVTNVSEGTGRITAFALNSRQTATNETITVESSENVIRRDVDEYERPLVTELSENSTNRWLTTYGYDDENDIRSIACTNTVGRGFTVEYTNDCGYALGYKVALPQGDVFTWTIQRDPYRRNLITSCGNAFNGTPLKSSAYSFDTLNRVTRRIDGGTVTNTFGYNARSEVASASILSNDYTFAYDFIGNHTTSTVDSVATAYSANNLNQYTAVLCAPAPLREPIFDLDGNLLTNGVFSYSWDAENRLVSVSSNGNLVVSNEYDYRHRRIRKTTPQATHDFIYDGWNLIHETIAPTNGSVSEVEYFWGVDLSGNLQGAGGVGGLLAVSIDGSLYFPLYDANGNITAYIDESGNHVAEYAYDAFGGTIAKSGSMADAFMHRFSTKYYDAETGLYYYGLRFYSPDLHRWLNRDPIEEQGGLNLYGFCANNVVNRWDAFGMSPSPVILEEIASVALSMIFGSWIIDNSTFMFYGGREEFIGETGRQLYARGALAGRMWDRSLSAPSLNYGKRHGNTLVITPANQTQWGDAIELIQATSVYREKVEHIKTRLKAGTSRRGFVNIQFDNPDSLSASIHGAQLHYSCSGCNLVLTVQDEYNFDKKHMWRRLQEEGYIIPYNVIIAMPKEKCGRIP